MTFGWQYGLIALVAVQRFAELLWARRNARALLARGGKETGAAHYPLFIALHGMWLLALAFLVAPEVEPNWFWLFLFVALQVLRIWIVATLGPYWTTRIITIDGQPSVRRGPYRYFRHPNYAVVALEIPALPLALGLPWVALAFGLLNGVLLLYRIAVEDGARAAAA